MIATRVADNGPWLSKPAHEETADSHLITLKHQVMRLAMSCIQNPAGDQLLLHITIQVFWLQSHSADGKHDSMHALSGAYSPMASLCMG